MKASVTPRMASGGPISTPDQKEAFLTAVRQGAADLWRLELAEENMALEIVGKLEYVELIMKRIVTILVSRETGKRWPWSNRMFQDSQSDHWKLLHRVHLTTSAAWDLSAIAAQQLLDPLDSRSCYKNSKA